MTKSKKFLNIFLAVAFALLTCGMALAVMLPSLSTSKVDRQVYADGDSTLSSMKTTTYGGQTFYQIENADQLTALAWSISVEGNATWASRNFELTKDVDIQLAGLNGSAIWTPIGTGSNPFKGKFNGNGHTVSGIVTGFEGSADDNLGLFGRVEGTSSSPAMIYDIVIDDFAFADYSSYPDLAGRLAGYIANAVLVDVYDYSFAMGDTDASRPLKTIGTVGTNVKYYTGGTFTANGTTYVSGTNFDATHGGQISDGRQFDWSNATGGITHAGYSLYVKTADASVAKIYAKGDSNKTNIAPYKIAITTSGSTATALTVYSANYFNELPQENEAKAANGQPVIEPVVGKKLSGWTLSGASGSYTKISEINTTSFASSNKYVQADFTDKTYTITVMRSSSTGSWASLGSVTLKANDTWANAVTKIEALRAGYFLTDLYKELTNSTHYYTNSISYNDNWDVVHNKNYPNGLRLNDWAESNITLYSTWVGRVSNANINFVNTNDDGAKLDSMTNLAIAYTNGEPVNSPDLALTTTGELGKYTFRAVADQNLTFTFKLPAGYEATQPSASGGATATLTGGTDGNYTISISGLTSSGGTITIPIQRKTITLNVSAANFTLSLSGNTSHTKISGSTITTKIGETFNIIATPAKGYEYSSLSVTDQFTTVGTPSVASNDVVTFPVTVNTFGSSQTLTITAKAKAFTIILDYDASVYASGVQLPQVSISTGSSQTVTATGDNRWDNLTPTNLVTIKTPGNAYFMPGVVTLTTNPDGTLSGGNGEYQIQPVGDAETIPGGAVFNINVTYAKRQYTATYGGRFATISGEGASSAAENFTAIKDVNGTELTDYNKVITITPSHTTYSFGDKITLSYNIVSDYYEFVGWYYSTGEYISNQNNAQITAGTSDVTVYAVVRGKTATFTVSTGNLIENYDGVENATHTSTLALSTPNVTQLSFTYSSPTVGAISFKVQTGYTGGRYILYNPSTAGNAWEQYNSGSAYLVTTSGNSVNGYASFAFEDGQNAESVFFDHSGWKLYPIVTQRTISIVASAGEGGVVADSSATSARNYYFGGAGFDITYAIKAFTKTGYTPTGWTFTVGGTQNIYDNSIVSGDRYLIDFTDYSSITSYLGKTITLNRTYTANTYKLYFKQNAGETLATEGLLHDDENGYYKNVVFDQQIGSLPTITKQGYQFASWGVNASDVYKTADNTTLNAQWNTLSYTVRIDFNGGNVSGATYQNVTVAYDGSIGTFGSYTANGLASLASSVKRKGFKFDAWH